MKELINLFSQEMTGIVGLFEQMEVVEEVIASYKKHPSFKLIDQCFLAFRSEIITSNYPVWVFRSHAKYIAKRIAQVKLHYRKKIIEDLIIPPTPAEVVVAISEASFIAPPKRNISNLAITLFTKIAKEEGVAIEITPSGMADWERKEAMDLLTHQLRRFTKKRAEVVWEELQKIKKEV